MDRYNSIHINNSTNYNDEYNDDGDSSSGLDEFKTSTPLRFSSNNLSIKNENANNSKIENSNNDDIDNENGSKNASVILEMNRLLNPLSSTKVLKKEDCSSPLYYYAIQEWKSISNLDRFLEKVYQYYEERGFLSLIFNRVSNLMIVAFLVFMIVMLTYGINWSFLHTSATASNHPKLWNVTRGLSGIPWYIWIPLVQGVILWIWLGPIRLIMEISEWQRVSRFYNILLQVRDSDLSSMEFDVIMTKIIKLHDKHPISLHRLDPLNIAMRIMRRENYLIALFNKDILNIDLPSIFFPSSSSSLSNSANSVAINNNNNNNSNSNSNGNDGNKKMKRSAMLTKTLEWNLGFCIINYFFDENLLIRPVLIKEAQKERLVEELQKRCFLMAIINLVFSPFIFVLILIHFIFRYGEQVYKNPKSMGERTFSPLSRWKLRHFNELPYYFQRRLSNSYKKAGKFMDQFHNDRWNGLARLISFISGSIVLILLTVTMINEDLLMHFEITKNRNPIWYIGLFGIILAISRSMLPEHVQSKDPEKLMTEISEYTHWLPSHWKRLGMRSEIVKQEFGDMFQYRAVLLLQELLSVIMTPFILYYRLPTCCDKVVEFFREFTVHVDGLGYVCSFALFDFRQHGNPKYGSSVYMNDTAQEVMAITDKHQRTKHGKMEQSFINFMENHPNWIPNEGGCMYFDKLKAEMKPSKRKSMDNKDEDMRISMCNLLLNDQYRCKLADKSNFK